MIGVQTLGKAIRRRMLRRAPDVLIGGDGTRHGCYMARWWVIPRNKWFNIYLHHFQHDDDDRALHDHPWWSCSILIEGAYYEHVKRITGDMVQRCTYDRVSGTWAIPRKAGDVAFRSATAAHRISLPRTHRHVNYVSSQSIPCWTIFITGRKVREWGFYCPKGWKHWKAFTGQDHNATGVGSRVASPGCGED